MIRVLLFYFLLVQLLFGYNYDDLLLKAQASIFPKIMLLDKKIENKLVKNKIIYTIVYDGSDYQTALHVKKYIETTFKGRFDKYPYEIHLVDFSHLSTDTKASAFYVLKSSTKNIQKAAKIAYEKRIISFSYDINNLKYGLLFSLIIENSTVLYLNKEYLHIKNIDFGDFLLQMVKFIDKNSI
ncbi:hypothetical protein [Sulfurimonas autotrophica]|uniref:Uncharacterized protein n=1 Tax=Sulfurimonas autotrophica (strain ATCC BAA-671 / DSM 16294 / JCM 11897 / OK10) TaxID=563040 RepID=E0UUK9_SULAO|nr:hypothetical protein [Sulfurimonas autotrophica]ADN08445.1 hypothetical protein Saut_0396 [Sulfurimonas autotrophica DSM 16294]